MIKFFLRKTLYRDVDRETQDMFLQIFGPLITVRFLCFMFWAVIYAFPFIPLFMVNILENVHFSLTTQIVIIIFAVLYTLEFVVLFTVFKKAMLAFSVLMAEKIYFLVCTKKGKALSKKDFETIKQSNEVLYDYISTQKCKGYCYSICFELCKVLKKGSIEFVAVKDYNKNVDNGCDYTMHALFVNNGWAFDTNSSRQYPVEEFHKIHNLKTYKVFDYNSFRDMSYYEFKDDIGPELAKWSAANNCSLFWEDNRK